MNQIHPMAIVDPEAKLGDNNVIGPFCVIDKNVIIGDNNKLYNGVTLHYGTRLGNGNEIFPGDIGIWLAETFHNNWLLGIGAGLLSAVADSFTVGLNHIMLYPLAESGEMAVNGAYWMIMVFSTAVGGCLLCVGSVSGVALMKMEHVRLGWYLRHLTSKVAVGWLLGLAVLWAE